MTMGSRPSEGRTIEAARNWVMYRPSMPLPSGTQTQSSPALAAFARTAFQRRSRSAVEYPIQNPSGVAASRCRSCMNDLPGARVLVLTQGSVGDYRFGDGRGCSDGTCVRRKWIALQTPTDDPLGPNAKHLRIEVASHLRSPTS